MQAVSTNRKPLAIGAATLCGPRYAHHVGWLRDGGTRTCDDALRWLRQVGPVESTQTDAGVELRCRVEFGPDRGSAGDLERHLRRNVGSLAKMIGANDYEIFDLAYSAFHTTDAINEQITTLKNQIDDARVSLAIRKRAEHVMVRLRKEAASMREVQHA